MHRGDGKQRVVRNRKIPFGESSRGPVGAWQSFTERNSGNTLREAAERLQPPSERDPEGRRRGDVLRAVPALREPVAARPSDHSDAGFGGAARQPHSVHINRETTSRDRAPLLPLRAPEHDYAGHAAAESRRGIQDDFRAQSGRVRRAPGGPGELRGCGREHGSHWGGRISVPLNAHGLLNNVGQKVYVQMTYKTRHRPEGKIAALGLFPRQRTEVGERVTESRRAPDDFLNGTTIKSQPTRSVPRQVRLAIERNLNCHQSESGTPTKTTTQPSVLGEFRGGTTASGD